MWKGHPKGLAVLFFTEMWERFGFYTMLAILALYMDEHFLLPKHISGNIYGAFIALVYFTPLFGGFLADKVLGYSRSIFIGAVLMGLGYAALAIDNFTFFLISLGIIALGNGFFKPNISTLLGNLYGDHNPLKDNGYSIFYMGINIGAFFSPLIASYMRNNFGWGYAFAAAAVGMVAAIVIFAVFGKHVQAVVHSSSTASEHLQALTPRQEKGRIWSLIAIFVIVVFFWMAFHQNAYTLTFWARDCTNTKIPAEIFQSINPFFVVFFTPLLVMFWTRLRRSGKEPSTPSKVAIGMLLTAICFAVMMLAALVGGDTGRVSVSWLVSSYAIVTLGELCLSPMGLSLVNKMSPARMRGLMMGGWFAATAVGNYLSGLLGSYWERMPHSRFFGLLVVTSMVAVVLMAAVARKINNAMSARPLPENVSEMELEAQTG